MILRTGSACSRKNKFLNSLHHCIYEIRIMSIDPVNCEVGVSLSETGVTERRRMAGQTMFWLKRPKSWQLSWQIRKTLLQRWPR